MVLLSTRNQRSEKGTTMQTKTNIRAGADEDDEDEDDE